jgi:arsenate reductase (glutaredoxin)
VNVQVFGFKDCQETRKALRFFSDRRIAVHFVDLKERPASKGELRRFADKHGVAALIDRDSPQRQLERALVEPRLLKTPLVRVDQRVSVGYTPNDWSGWIKT